MSMRVNSLRDRQKWQPDLFMQIPVGIGFACIDGYFYIKRHYSASASDSFQPRSLNAQTTSGDLQPGAGTASHRERPNRLASELPVLRRHHRERTESFSAATAIACNAEMHSVWANSPVHRRGRVKGDLPLRSHNPCSCIRNFLGCTSIVFSRESPRGISLS